MPVIAPTTLRRCGLGEPRRPSVLHKGIGSWPTACTRTCPRTSPPAAKRHSRGIFRCSRYPTPMSRPVLDAGEDALHKCLLVASVLSHEVLQTFCDQSVNLWADRG